MATFFDDVYKDAKSIWNDISDYVPLIAGSKGSAINDLNKEANKNTVTLYTVLSDNVPASVSAILAKNIYIKYTAAIMTILQNTILKDPKEAQNFFSTKFGYDNSKVQGYVDTVLGSTMVENLLNTIDESSMLDLIDSIQINESSISNTSLNEAKFRKVARNNALAQHSPNSMTASQLRISKAIKNPNPTNTSANAGIFNTELSQFERDAELEAQRELEAEAYEELLARSKNLKQELSVKALEEKQRRLIDSTVNLKIEEVSDSYFGGDKSNNVAYLNFGGKISASFKLLDNNLTPVPITISFHMNVKMMRIEAHKISEVIKSTRERDNFYQYLKYRAGASHFFKDFILNLKEIEKEVERKTSANLAERLLNDMVRTSGLTMPKILGDISETRHFILVLDKSDVDDLRRVERIDVESRGPLEKLFNSLRILSLLICNADRSELTFYDSNDPSKYDIQNYSRLTNESDALKRFISNMRG